MFKNAVDVFDIFGFRVRIDPSWLLIAALLIWSLSSSYFPSVLPDLSRSDYVAIGTASMLAMFASLIAHEVSHSLVARLFGLRVGGITLFIFGGVAELETEPVSPKSEFWIAIAGPAMSFSIAGGAYVVANTLAGMAVSTVLVEFFNYLALVNLVLAGFNLVPAFPLDGGRIMRAILWHLKGNLFSATKVASSFGSAFGFLLIVAGIFSLFSSNAIGGLWQILIGFFVVGASRSAYQQLVISEALREQTVSALMTPNPVTTEPDHSIRHLVEEIILKNNKSFVPVVEGDHALGYIDTALAGSIENEDWSNTLVEDIYEPANQLNTTGLSTPMEKVFAKMVSSGRSKLMVVEAGVLLGVLSLSDLMTYLAIRDGLGLTDRKKGTFGATGRQLGAEHPGE